MVKDPLVLLVGQFLLVKVGKKGKQAIAPFHLGVMKEELVFCLLLINM